MAAIVSTVSDAGRTFIEGFEGCQLRAYLCPAGVWTIGFGHTNGVRAGQVLQSIAAADVLLSTDLTVFSAELVHQLAGVPTNQHQFDAMASLSFNIGTGAFASSTVLKMHRAANYTAAASAFNLWGNALVDGQLVPLPGLVRRRAAESVVYLTANDDQHPMPAPVSTGPMPQAVGAPAGMLCMGMSGERVALVQGELAHLQLYPGKLDGDFGPATRASVIAFQRRARLSVDGVVGGETQTALDKAAA